MTAPIFDIFIAGFTPNVAIPGLFIKQNLRYKIYYSIYSQKNNYQMEQAPINKALWQYTAIVTFRRINLPKYIQGNSYQA